MLLTLISFTNGRKWECALTKNLHFNVPWLFNELLNKQGPIAKSGQCFRVGPLVIFLKFLTNRQRMSQLVFLVSSQYLYNNTNMTLQQAFYFELFIFI